MGDKDEPGEMAPPEDQPQQRPDEVADFQKKVEEDAEKADD